MRLLAISLPLLLAACGSQVEDRDTSATPAAASRPGGERPVILAELFTSQGCSSCPPADRLLSSIQELAPAGAEVVPLAFHVDYWDDLGWKDPFSAGAWTERQQRYAARVTGGRVYTPMLVVQGREHLVGSDRGQVAAALGRAAARAGATGAAVAARMDGSDRLAVDATAGGAPAIAWLALVESGIATEVRRGENRGRLLANDFVVRRLVRAFEIAPHQRKSETVALAIDPAWRPDALAAVLFLQDPVSLEVAAAARATLGP